jgi:hypothetical protein
MATVKIWYHDAFSKDQRGWPTPVVNEPSLIPGDEAEVITTPATTQGAPSSSVYAIIETNIDIRYTVRQPGDTTTVATVNHKLISAGTNAITVRPGQTIHFIEA